MGCRLVLRPAHYVLSSQLSNLGEGGKKGSLVYGLVSDCLNFGHPGLDAYYLEIS